MDRFHWAPAVFDPMTQDEIDDAWDDIAALDEARRKARERR